MRKNNFLLDPPPTPPEADRVSPYYIELPENTHPATGRHDFVTSQGNRKTGMHYFLYSDDNQCWDVRQLTPYTKYEKHLKRFVESGRCYIFKEV